MRWRSRFFASLLACAPAAGVDAASLKVDYSIKLAGLTLGTADLDGTFDGDRYDMRLKGQLTGLAGAFTGGSRGSATAAGSLGPTRLNATGFSATGESSSAQRTVRMGVTSGNVTRVEIDPPFEPRPDRVPVTDAQRRGIIDPLSAMVAVSSTRARGDDAATCSRTIPVFDGTQRFDVVLSYAETKAVQKPGFSGNVLVCSVRYVPIAGHRAERPAVKFMAETRDISVWLAPVDGTRVLVPIRISVPTLMGTSVVEAERWSLDATAGRAATR